MSSELSAALGQMQRLAAERRKRQLAQKRLDEAVDEGDSALQHLHQMRKDDQLQVVGDGVWLGLGMPA